MNQALDILMHEHRVIEGVLDALEAYAASVHGGAPLDRQRVSEFAEFLAGFADACHHGKEEDILFTQLVEQGFPREYGPIAVMLVEHGHGREHVAAFKALGAGQDAVTGAEREEFLVHVADYVSLLRHHIQKEDRVLYPLAADRLPGQAFEGMVADFERFERDVMGEGRHEVLHRLGDRLLQAAGQAGAATSCGCHHAAAPRT